MNKIYYFILPICILWSACNDFLEYKDNDKIIPKELSHYNELVYGELIYKTKGDEMLSLQLMTDEAESVVEPLSSSWRRDGRIPQINHFTWAVEPLIDPSGEEQDDNSWSFFYHKILMCNIVEHALKDFEDDTEGVKKRLLGEVSFLRAMSYYYLVNLYGEPYKNKEQARTALGVPINSAISIEVETYTRSTLQEVYNLIETDLLNALNFLSQGEKINSKFRPNIAVSRLFLSRVYLYQKEWEKARQVCNDLIGSGVASISTLEQLTNYNTNDKPLYNDKNSSILYSWGTRYEYPFKNNSDAGHWKVSTTLRNMYVAEDIRGKAFFSKVRPFYPYKYYTSGRTCYDWSYRIEEAFLNRAEACIELGGEKNLQQALEDINSIRQQRIDKEDYKVDVTQMSGALELLRNEKKMEFCFEDTQWFDIRRWEIEITHEVQDINNPMLITKYVLKAGSPNYFLSLPLEVSRINPKIEKFTRIETLK